MKKFLCCLTFFLFTVTFTAEGAIYQWEDTDGTVHFTDDFKKIPEQYRHQVEKKTSSRPKKPPAQVETRQSSALEKKINAEGIAIKERSWWQGLARKWEGKQTESKGRIKELEIELNLLESEKKIPEKTKKKEKLRIEKAIKSAHLRHEIATRMLTSGLPEEAKRSGVPIEWLSTKP